MVCSCTRCRHSSNTSHPTTLPAACSSASRRQSAWKPVGRSRVDLTARVHARFRAAASTRPANDGLHASSHTRRAAWHAVRTITAHSDTTIFNGPFTSTTVCSLCQTIASGTPCNSCVAVLHTPLCICSTAGLSAFNAPQSCCNADTTTRHARIGPRTTCPAHHV